MKIVFMKEGKSMLTKKKKFFIILGMAILLVVTGYLNVKLNSTTQIAQTTEIEGDFFATYRQDRNYTRNLELSYLDAIITSSSSTADYVSTATNKKLALVAQMDRELILEGLIAGAGFQDVIVSGSADNLNIIVKSDGLTSNDVAKILTIVTEETKIDATNVKISSIC